MTRNFKALGLALVAVFALSAMAASSASAVDTITGPGGTFSTSGTSHDNSFRLTNASGGTVVAVECTTSTLSATGVTSGASSITFTASYTGIINETPHTNTKCTSTGGSSTLNMNGCAYIITGNTTGSDGGTDAILSVECTPSSNEITVATSLGCTLKIPAQTPTSGGVTYTNEAGGKVKIKVTSTGITFTTEGFGCAVAGIPSEGNNADYTGNVVASSASGGISDSTS